MELDRKFRVLDQTLSMHAALRDRYARRALTVDSLLLGCSVVFCASAFASDAALAHFGNSPDQIRYLVRLSSVVAFMLSVLSLKIDWKGKFASHKDAAARMSHALATFRNSRSEDGGWLPGCDQELDSAYWEAMNNSVPIPDRSFVSLKARHLRKVALSKMLDANPGYPLLLLRMRLLWAALKRGRSQKN